MGADMILTHHPLIFKAPKTVTTDDTVGQCILFLAANGISAVNAHTNLDCAPEGVNDVLAQTLGLEDVEVAYPMGTDSEGRAYGLLRTGTISRMPLSEFLALVKDRLHTPVLRYADGGKPVHRIAVGGGACGDSYAEALAAGCDTLVTADVKYNQFWDAHDLGLNLIDAGHFPTEDPFCSKVIAYLTEQFPELSVTKSTSHREVIQYYVKGE